MSLLCIPVLQIQHIHAVDGDGEIMVVTLLKHGEIGVYTTEGVDLYSCTRCGMYLVEKEGS